MRSFSFRTAILLFVSGIRNSDDHSAAYDSISVIQNGGLAGCDSPLLLIKFDVKTVLPRLLHHGRTSAVTVAYFHLRSDFSRETAAGDQIDIAHVQLFPEEKCLLPHAHDISLCILFTDEMESLILSTAEKYLPQFNLVMSAPGIQSFAAIGIISEIGVDMSVFPTSKHLCSWLGLRRKTTRVPARRKPLESVEPEPTSSPCWYNVRSVPFEPSCSRKSATAISLSKSAGDTRKPLSQLPGCSLQLSTICSRKMSLTILNYTGRQTGLPHIVRFLLKKQFLFFNGRVIW